MYTDERNIQIVIALLKAHGIKYVVASPGSMNLTFVTSIQDDKDFVVFSCVDERSAAYMACGIAAEKKEPVVLSCTGATASRNYMPGLTEAFYRKLPILAITSCNSRSTLDMLYAQQINRTQLPKDIAVESLYIPCVSDDYKESICERDVNKAILSLFKNGGGPVHIDLCSKMSLTGMETLPPAKAIHRYTHLDALPEIPQGRIGIMIGVHAKMDEQLITLIDNFCSTYDAIVYSVNPKSYTGEYAANVSLLFSQINYIGNINKPDLCIHIGEVTPDAVGFALCPKQVWRVSIDGDVKDRYGCLTKVFQMTDQEFFAYYAPSHGTKVSQLNEWEKEDANIRSQIPDIPFSNCWIAQEFSQLIPEDAELHLGIANSVRAWDYANPPRNLHTNANIGGYGIDGCVSTMIGASLVSPEKQFYGIFGDLAFFYDMNIIGSRHIGNNVHILLINNDGGQQFRNSDHPAYEFGYDKINPYVAAKGHFGAKQTQIVQHLAEDFGLTYLSVSSKEDFMKAIPVFVNSDKAIILEVFTKAEEEEIAFTLIRNILKSSGVKLNKTHIKRTIKNAIGREKVNAIKTLLGI